MVSRQLAEWDRNSEWLVFPKIESGVIEECGCVLPLRFFVFVSDNPRLTGRSKSYFGIEYNVEEWTALDRDWALEIVKDFRRARRVEKEQGRNL